MQKLSDEQFLTIYDTHAEAIYRHCFFRVFSRELAEDLTQETFIRAWEYAQKDQVIENWKALLYRIATNLIIDHSRKKHPLRLDEALEHDPASLPKVDGAREIETSVLFAEVRSAFKRLRKEEETLLTLRYIDDLDPKEIAEIQGTTANNISVKLHNALQKIKKLI